LTPLETLDGDDLADDYQAVGEVSGIRKADELSTHLVPAGELATILEHKKGPALQALSL